MREIIPTNGDVAFQNGLHILVDDNDYSRVAAYSWKVVLSRSTNEWCATAEYTKENGRTGTTRLHKFLAPVGTMVVAEDGNKLNCCRENLIFLNPREYGRIWCKWKKTKT